MECTLNRTIVECVFLRQQSVLMDSFSWFSELFYQVLQSFGSHFNARGKAKCRTYFRNYTKWKWQKPYLLVKVTTDDSTFSCAITHLAQSNTKEISFALQLARRLWQAGIMPSDLCLILGSCHVLKTFKVIHKIDSSSFFLRFSFP